MYTVHKAKTYLSKLIRDALKGEEVIIARRKEPVVRLVPVRKHAKKRVPGSLKGKIWYAPDAFDPLTKEELAEWGIE
ncbi:MAG: type II toxin-antitoxin system prevent-host-death family antitoxin [Candidatus Acidiferrum sp.]